MNLILGLLIGAAVFIGGAAAVQEGQSTASAQEVSQPAPPVHHSKPKPKPKVTPKPTPAIAAVCVPPVDEHYDWRRLLPEHEPAVEVKPVVTVEPHYELDWWKLLEGLILIGALGILGWTGRKLYQGYKVSSNASGASNG